MRTVTWRELEPDAVEYATVNIGRLTQSVWQVARNDIRDYASAQRWLCDNTPRSVLGLDYINRNTLVRAVMLTEETNLVLDVDLVRTLPAGTDVRAVYSGDIPQFVTFDLPDERLGVRAVPPYCARVHDGQPLVPSLRDSKALLTQHGQMELLIETRALAVKAGSNSHVRDIDKRLEAMQTQHRGAQKFAC